MARLADDHAHATQLEATLSAHADVASVDPVETNIVIFSLHGNHASEAVQALAAVGVGCFAFGPDKVRLVTHLDMTPDDVHEVSTHRSDPTYWATSLRAPRRAGLVNVYMPAGNSDDSATSLPSGVHTASTRRPWASQSFHKATSSPDTPTNEVSR